ncbi:uncharacterized protein PG998_004467 [Apiospora kogelbergensis]|uniref:uncharacterized protein n=1 Tax=Apiospora kogelbergensis TaxID=1337665 RepID=UPI00312E4D24
MSRSDSIKTRGEDYVSARSSAGPHDKYHIPSVLEHSTKDSSCSASASRRRTWSPTPVNKRRKRNESPEIEIQRPFRTEDSSTAGRIPIILEKGPPRDILFQCPEQKTLYYSTVWYKLLAQADFLACSRCYLTHIKGTSLTHSFVRFTPPTGAPSRCRFWVPRVVSILWPQALRCQSVRGILGYAKRRDVIPDCPNDGSELEPPEKKRRWLCYVDEEIGRLECCEACYEDRVVGTAFASKFEATPELSEDTESKKCILSIPNIHYSLESYAKCGDWTSFLVAARQRLRAPDCKGEMVPTSSTDWFIRLETGPFLICEACFLDKVAMTTFRDYFTQAGDNAHNANGNFRCSLAVGSVMVALEAARARDDYAVFTNAIQAITNSKFCSREGIRGGPWYTLQGGCRGFQICHACYCGIIAPCELGPFFDLADAETNSDSAVRLCDLNPAAPRFASFVEKLAQVVDVGDFSVFDRFVRQILVRSPCPRGSTSDTRLWCCADGCTVCPECFKTVVADTAFARRFVIQRVSQPPAAVVCSLSSPRMRRKWAEACRNESIEEFLSIARFRQEVYKRARSGIQRLQRLHGSRVGLALADVLLDSRVTAENVRMVLSAGEDVSASRNSSRNDLLATSTDSDALEKFMKDIIASTRRKEEQQLIKEIKDVWNAIN